MTTLVAIQQPLELISMSEKPVRRSKRQPAVVADYEQDDDFHFVRKSKKVKVDEDKVKEKEKENVKEKDVQEKALAVRKSARGRPATRVKKGNGAVEEQQQQQREEEEETTTMTNTVANTMTTTTTTTAAAAKRSTRRKQVQQEEEEEGGEEPPLKVARKTAAARGGRAAKRGARVSAADELETGPQADMVPEAEAEPEQEPEPEPEPKVKPKAKAKAKARGRPNGRAKDKAAPAQTPVPIPKPIATSTPKPVMEDEQQEQDQQQDDGNDDDDDDDDDAMRVDTDEPAKIALPMSDTPIINRNKEMRKKGGASNRRSSLGSRGRRASSLIDSGQAAIPHREVDTSEFWKHIAAEGLPEPRRMKQLLMWCGERALAAKPKHGNLNSAAILGARAIQDQLLKDFASKSQCSNWFDREDEAPPVPVVLQPNPRNVELDEKKKTLEAKIKRLQEEKKSWLAIRKPPPEQPPLFTPEEAAATTITLPDLDLLDPDDTRIRGFLADEAHSYGALRGRTEARLRRVQAALEFEVDALADGVHKLEQRVRAAGRQAERVLALSSARLREREERDRQRAGTREMPIMEVLRSLSSILPEGGG